MKRLCVFDLDGTLVDSVCDIADAVNRSLEKMGKLTHPVDLYYKMVGNGMEMLCRRSLPDGTEEDIQCLISLYREDYIRNCCVKTSVYPGIFEMLKTLSDAHIQLAILSNKPQEQTEAVVSKLFGNDRFSSVLGAGPRFPRKPDPTSLYHTMELFHVGKRETFYIGDSDVDMQLANAAGVDGIGVSWGFRGRTELEQSAAKYVADYAYELQKYILKEAVL